MNFAIHELSLFEIIPCLLLAALYAWILYGREQKLPKAWRNALTASRFVVAFILAILLAGPLLTRFKNRIEKPILLVAQDNSASILATDQKSFYQGKYLEERNAALQSLERKYEVKTILLGADLRYSNAVDYSDTKSNIAAVLDELKQGYAQQNVAAVILASDGIGNTGNDIESYLRDMSTPVYTVLMGDSVQKKDLGISKLSSNEIGYKNNSSRVDIFIKAYDFANTQHNINIVDEEGKVIWQSKFSCSKKQDWIKINAAIPLGAVSGLRKFKVQIPVAANEFNVQNNSRTFTIDVLDGRQKIAILASAAHPDLAAIKTAIESKEQYEVDLFIGDEIPVDQLRKYQVLVLHQIPSKAYQGGALQDYLAREGVPYLSILGAQSYLDLFNQWATGLSINGQRSNTNESTPIFNENFTAFTLSEESKNSLIQFPPLYTPFGNYTSSAELQALFQQRIGNTGSDYPMLAFKSGNGQRIAVLAGEGFWRWRMYEYKSNGNTNASNEILQKTLQYLGSAADKRKFKVGINNASLEENEVILFDATLYNDNYELINTPDVSMSIKNKNGKTYSFQFDRDEKKYTLNAGNLPVGNYTYVATCNFGKNNYSYKGSFQISRLNTELQETVANFEILRKLSNSSGGKAHRASEWKNLAEDLNKEEQFTSISRREKSSDEAIHFKFIFFLILSLISIEWFARKYFGLY
jgi:hypothetical protein